MEKKPHRCPWWLGYLLINPLRKLMQNPDRILSKYITKGMITIDYGSGMGYFSLPLAKLVGADGKVICVDVQDKMIKSLIKRAEKRNIVDRIKPILITDENNLLNNLKDEVDFVLLFAVAHEVNDKEKLFSKLYKTIKKNGKLLFSEPKAHVKKNKFNDSVLLAEKSGFKIINHPKIFKSLSVLLGKE